MPTVIETAEIVEATSAPEAVENFRKSSGVTLHPPAMRDPEAVVLLSAYWCGGSSGPEESSTTWYCVHGSYWIDSEASEDDLRTRLNVRFEAQEYRAFAFNELLI